ncbi:unnamed protein product [Penicillium roqueforti FM164]|uniref:Uncharacterized protein n=1 Tax=Penicillium roqueforti (strain FM164) TaxID=1365484 RepID=W6QV72_PENRF|nr:unnamed protein product [Penicillium roqueforti FM164]
MDRYYMLHTWLVTPPSPRLTARPPSSSPGALGGD